MVMLVVPGIRAKEGGRLPDEHVAAPLRAEVVRLPVHLGADRRGHHATRCHSIPLWGIP